jgi:hypothetical protein
MFNYLYNFSILKVSQILFFSDKMQIVVIFFLSINFMTTTLLEKNILKKVCVMLYAIIN